MSEKIYNVDGSEATPPPLHKVFLSCNLKKELSLRVGGVFSFMFPEERKMKVCEFAPVMIIISPSTYLFNYKNYNMCCNAHLLQLFSVCPN